MRNILIAALVLSASAAQAQDCDSVRDTFNRNISTVNATLAASPTDDIAYQAWIDLQVNGEWLLQHNCNVDRKKLNEISWFRAADKHSWLALPSQRPAFESLLNASGTASRNRRRLAGALARRGVESNASICSF